MASRAVLIVLCAGCIDELPAPAECPAPARVAAPASCDLDPPLTGCLPPEEHACFAGPRASCACAADECPASPDACYPAGDCPPEVIAIAGPGAVCATLAEDLVGEFGILEAASVCRCGCNACLSVCDGHGPTFGAMLQGDGALDSEDAIFPLVRVDALLPAAGRMGLYARVRTTQPLVTIFYAGEPYLGADQLMYLAGGTVSPSTDFRGHVIFDELIDQQGRAAPLVWTDASQKPSVMLTLPPTSVPGPILTEIDCVVPFWVP